MHWIKTGATNFHAQLGLPNNGCLVVLPYLIPWTIEQYILQFTYRVNLRLCGEDLYLKPQEVISQTIWGRVKSHIQKTLYQEEKKPLIYFIFKT